eukprot:TRINITY_DN5783_c0_g1_i1.p1 TRINITY_DN5783_c0_g1~~TRINITY_DN5783_c0_g1_i1.p1  ORF type:complete len:336 (+),score=66.48 TRINITY_DN5783_c0_g1_i1:135-1142(+)
MSDFRLILNHDPDSPSRPPPVTLKEEVQSSNLALPLSSPLLPLTPSSSTSSSLDYHSSDHPQSSYMPSLPRIHRYSPYPTHPPTTHLDSSASYRLSPSHNYNNTNNDIKPYFHNTFPPQYQYPSSSSSSSSGDYYPPPPSSTSSSSTTSTHPLFSFKQQASPWQDDSDTVSPQSSPSPSSSPSSPSRGAYNPLPTQRLLSPPPSKSLPSTPLPSSAPVDGDEAKSGKRKLVVTSDLLKMKQMNAAMKIGVPPSTFSKRWRESLPQRTWPYRNHRRIEKNIKMLKSMQQRGQDVTAELQKMKEQRDLNLAPAVIDVYEDVNEEYLLRADSATRHNI